MPSQGSPPVPNAHPDDQLQEDSDLSNHTQSVNHQVIADELREDVLRANETVSHSQQEHQGTINPVDAVDAMGANLHPETTGGEDPNSFYGGSSTVSFVEQVYQTIGLPTAPSQVPTHRPTTRICLPLQDSNVGSFHLSPEKFSILPKTIMDPLMDCYWRKVHPLYPFIHRATFCQACELLWTSERGVDVLSAGTHLGTQAYGPNTIEFHCALNAMLALATQFMDFPATDRDRLGHFFSEKSRSLCFLDLFDDASLAFIQTLLLVSQFLQSSPFPTRCWNCIGIACRLAQNAGLHIDPSKHQRAMSPLEVEMRRRVWHGCVMLDAAVGMALGRPLMFHNHASVSLPTALPDEAVEDVGSLTGGRAAMTDFYISAIHLSEISIAVLTQFYGSSDEALQISSRELVLGDLNAVLQFDKRLAQFKSSLPLHLKWYHQSTSTDASPMLLLQRSVLHARYLNVRVLLHRPIFGRFCRAFSNRASEDLETAITHDVSSSLAEALSTACVNAATNLIDHLHVHSRTEATGPWWYNIYYIRVSAIVILLAMACRPIVQNISELSLSITWDKCRATLLGLQVYSPRALSYLRGLDKLHEQVLGYNARAGSSHGHLHHENVSQRAGVGSYGMTDSIADQPGVTQVSANSVPQSASLIMDVAQSDLSFENLFSFDLTESFFMETENGFTY
ncbi:hypothetical protein B0A52_10107 [Exophiala mesophila]|uniref:Xylanolytic transcriptional activator regulatory domain-containing protein n=1 Tax=Exophiala mesophila TaxID=212818 RepID=A0A438MQV7_EXOME|nr:hypothetical protein B0A52_10107 [Exophiala mesophila]